MDDKIESTTEGKPVQRHKIQTVPLTEILDEIENSIRMANEAARDARKAAEEARMAGEKAANEAARVASQTIAKVEELAKKALALAELVKLAGMDASTSYQKRISEKLLEKQSK